MWGRRKSGRWAERHSVLSTFEHVFEAAVNASRANLNNDLTACGRLAVNTFPMIVPRACRITRYSVRVQSFAVSALTMTVVHETSQDCELFTPIEEATEHTHAIPSEGLVCFCQTLDPSLILDECWLWRPRITFSPNIVNPRVRLTTHLELR